jgi:hypothetical protein
MLAPPTFDPAHAAILSNTPSSRRPFHASPRQGFPIRRDRKRLRLFGPSYFRDETRPGDSSDKSLRRLSKAAARHAGLVPPEHGAKLLRGVFDAAMVQVVELAQTRLRKKGSWSIAPPSLPLPGFISVSSI